MRQPSSWEPDGPCCHINQMAAATLANDLPIQKTERQDNAARCQNFEQQRGCQMNNASKVRFSTGRFDENCMRASGVHSVRGSAGVSFTGTVIFSQEPIFRRVTTARLLHLCCFPQGARPISIPTVPRAHPTFNWLGGIVSQSLCASAFPCAHIRVPSDRSISTSASSLSTSLQARRLATLEAKLARFGQDAEAAPAGDAIGLEVGNINCENRGQRLTLRQGGPVLHPQSPSAGHGSWCISSESAGTSASVIAPNVRAPQRTKAKQIRFHGAGSQPGEIIP